jgi:hypothetical protein
MKEAITFHVVCCLTFVTKNEMIENKAAKRESELIFPAFDAILSVGLVVVASFVSERAPAFDLFMHVRLFLLFPLFQDHRSICSRRTHNLLSLSLIFWMIHGQGNIDIEQ